MGQKEDQRRYYIANRDRLLAYQKRNSSNYTKRLFEIKRRVGCQRCGINDPVVLVFHHRIGSTKLFDLATSGKGRRKWETVEREIAKCDVLCANCHTRLHWDERHPKRLYWSLLGGYANDYRKNRME